MRQVERPDYILGKFFELARSWRNQARGKWQVAEGVHDGAREAIRAHGDQLDAAADELTHFAERLQTEILKPASTEVPP